LATFDVLQALAEAIAEASFCPVLLRLGARSHQSECHSHRRH
jgi:hypothetical protein